MTLASACLGAVAYAAARPGQDTASLARSKPVVMASLPRARFLEYPEAISVVAEPLFRFHVPPRSTRPRRPSPGPPAKRSPPRRFQCRLDGGGWRACRSPYLLNSPDLGDHVFAVRALSRAGRTGPPVSYFWRQAKPSPGTEPVEDSKHFSIELDGELEDLQPGYPAQLLPVLVTNPNRASIEVTSLSVSIAEEPPGCSAENFTLTPAGASAETPLRVPARGSVRLPTSAVSAPAIGMRETSVNQDACQGVDVALVFDGEAHG